MPKLKLPEKLDLGANGTLEDSTDNGSSSTWHACRIIDKLIVDAEKSAIKPHFTKFYQRKPVRLSGDFLTKQLQNETSPQRYGRTTVHGNVAVKMQRKATEFDFRLLPVNPQSEFLFNTFYLSTKQIEGTTKDEGCVEINYKIKTASGVKEGTLSICAAIHIFPLPSPLTEQALGEKLPQIKKEVLLDAVNNNYIPQNHDAIENPECMADEINRQSTLRQLPQIKSKIPKPIGIGVDAQSERHYCAFEVPEGYYTYLSDIQDETTFIDSACRAAHDLGLLLRKGYVFQNLISVFHDKGRPYTLLPSVTQVNHVDFGGLPGRIDGVVGETLYENIGQSGLRDLGDLEFIEDFRFDKGNQYNQSGNKIDAPNSLKIAHFISLYLMIFTILLGNRSRKLEQAQPDADHWADNDKRYSKILNALFDGLGIKLSEEDLHYIDLSQMKGQQKSDGSKRLMQPGEKFNAQLRAWFTTKDSINDQVASAKTEKELQKNVYGSEKPSYARLAHHKFEEECYLQPGLTFCSYSTREKLWKDSPGSLGQSPSGPNPLVTALKYNIRAGQLAVEKMHQQPSAQLNEEQQEHQKKGVSPTLFKKRVEGDSQPNLEGMTSVGIHCQLGKR